jgi:hypothetical protein
MLFSEILTAKVKQSDFLLRLLNEKKVIVDNTEFTYWNSCFVSGLWNAAIRKVSTLGQTPLIFGEAAHRFLEHRLRGASFEESMSAADLVAIEKKLDGYLDPKRNRSNLRLMLESYDQHVAVVPSERIKPYMHNGVPMIEQKFSIPLGSFTLPAGIFFPQAETIQVIWSGTIDVIGSAGMHDGLWVIDHKTTAVMGPKFADSYIRSSQMLGYHKATQLIVKESGLRIEGVLINALASRSTGYEFKHFLLPMATWKLEEWHSETIYAVMQLVINMSQFLSTSEAVPNREHCVTKYGRCSYFDLCESPLVLRHKMLNDPSFFTDNLWRGNHA